MLNQFCNGVGWNEAAESEQSVLRHDPGQRLPAAVRSGWPVEWGTFHNANTTNNVILGWKTQTKKKKHIHCSNVCLSSTRRRYWPPWTLCMMALASCWRLAIWCGYPLLTPCRLIIWWATPTHWTFQEWWQLSYWNVSNVTTTYSTLKKIYSINSSPTRLHEHEARSISLVRQ